jgi:predicted PhzF superfamily epimerase YddE/YHI9
MERRYYVIDVFTSQRFAGNPAAVVLDTENLSEGQMQAIATEFNLSETTFILPPDNRAATERKRTCISPSVSFRWFTPAAEVDMCGHATIAGVHAMLEAGTLAPDATSPLIDDPCRAYKGSGYTDTPAREALLAPTSGGKGRLCGSGKEGNLVPTITLRIDTRSGPLTAFVEPLPGRNEGRMIWLELLPPELRDHPMDLYKLGAALRVAPESFEPSLSAMRTQDGDLIVFVKDMFTLTDATPDFAALCELLRGQGLRGLSLATANTVTPSISVQSRFFCPTVGINEDPVTGSVHGPLAAYLVRHGLIPVHEGIAGLMAVQGRPGGRSGMVSALVEGKDAHNCSVRIGGDAVTVMRGVLIA